MFKDKENSMQNYKELHQNIKELNEKNNELVLNNNIFPSTYIPFFSNFGSSCFSAKFI